MGRRRTSFDEAKIARFLKEGRGAGRGAEYKPWLTTQDVPSSGREHRVFSRKTGRIHHLLSDGEWRLFLHLEWCDDVQDIREQFPLDRLETGRIAEQLGVRHPQDVQTKVRLVMTTDFVVDVVRGGKLMTEALSFKPSGELEKPRTLEKLQVERSYWELQGVSWRIVTERDLHMVLVRNLEWVRTPAYEFQEQPWDGHDEDVANHVLKAITAAPDQSLGTFCSRTDERLSVAPGTTLMVVRTLLGAKRIRTYMTVPINTKTSMKGFLVDGLPSVRSAG
ncbi:MAG: TnsA endonuclease N-terminal domain-containing protein [Candidatus Zixiibacteriota bacterium]